MAAPCPFCLPLDCDLLEDTNLYSIEQSLFPFVLNCPPGFDCSNPTQFSMVCCGQVLSAQFPPGATVDDKQTIITAIVNQCGTRLAFCGDLPNIPNTPIILLYNRTQQCTVFCPDGSPFVYIVAAGTFAGTDQATVDKQAADFACVQAGLRKVCLGPIPSCLCVGSPYSYTLKHTGGIPPFTWTLLGTIPPGLTLDQTGTIIGTPTTNGIYSFSVRITCADGSYMTKAYSMTVLEITTTVMDAYSVGTPYSFQLQVAGGSGQYLWKIIAGSLPAGLTFSNTGLISGVPT